MKEYILRDNFFKNVDDVRNYALSLNYNTPTKNDGWKGYRVRIDDFEILNYIKLELIKIDSKFSNFEFDIFFHYTTSNIKNSIKNFEKDRLHKDLKEWAGVIYLSPNPIPNSGTTLHDDDGKLLFNIENKYNRLILYKGDILHGVLDTFGDNIENSRLTITLFGDNKNKNLI